MKRPLFLLCLLLAACSSDLDDPNKRAAKPAPVLTPPNQQAAKATPATTTPALTAPPVNREAYIGHWSVANVLPFDANHPMPLRIGTTLWLLDNQASDLDGRLCNGPVYEREKGDLAKLGAPMQITGNGPIPVTLLEVTCGQSDFGTYILHPDGYLLLKRPEALYILERMGMPEETETATAEPPAQKPSAPAKASASTPKTEPIQTKPQAKSSAPAPAAADEPPPPTAQPVPKVKTAPLPTAEAKAVSAAPAQQNGNLPSLTATKTAAPVSDKGKAPVSQTAPVPAAEEPARHLAHLASYKGKSAAQKGWQILTARYPDLKHFRQRIVELQVPGQGDIYRLFAASADKKEVEKLCATLAAKHDYCVPMEQ